MTMCDITIMYKFATDIRQRYGKLLVKHTLNMYLSGRKPKEGASDTLYLQRRAIMSCVFGHGRLVNHATEHTNTFVEVVGR